MTVYHPDKWVVVKDNRNGDHRVMGSWYGGYLSGDSWRLSSGVTAVVDKENHYEVHNYSGSVYVCGKGDEGVSAYASSVLSQYEDFLARQEHGEKVLEGLQPNV